MKLSDKKIKEERSNLESPSGFILMQWGNELVKLNRENGNAWRARKDTLTGKIVWEAFI